jgi:HlyD family secretion protein
MKRNLWVALLLVTGAAAGWLWWRDNHKEAKRELVLYGNIDLRQVQLAFNNSERIAAVLVQEGDRVKQGQVLARLDTRRLEPQFAQSAAQAAAQRQVVARQGEGMPPPKIAQPRGQVEKAKADHGKAPTQ